ncbi:hypothetical protein MCEMSEM23_02499 [Rhabdaerophilaceae bacterium]
MIDAVETITTSPPWPTLQESAERAGAPFEALKALCEPMPRDSKRPSLVLHSVWSFLAATEPGTLMLMQDPVEGLAEENRRARDLAEAMGHHAVERGEIVPVGMVWAVPPMVLERLFPVNP